MWDYLGATRWSCGEQIVSTHRWEVATGRERGGKDLLTLQRARVAVNLLIRQVFGFGGGGLCEQRVWRVSWLLSREVSTPRSTLGSDELSSAQFASPRYNILLAGVNAGVNPRCCCVNKSSGVPCQPHSQKANLVGSITRVRPWARPVYTPLSWMGWHACRWEKMTGALRGAPARQQQHHRHTSYLHDIIPALNWRKTIPCIGSRMATNAWGCTSNLLENWWCGGGSLVSAFRAVAASIRSQRNSSPSSPTGCIMPLHDLGMFVTSFTSYICYFFRKDDAQHRSPYPLQNSREGKGKLQGLECSKKELGEYILAKYCSL
ncbi:uncharacterized protein BDR25DRAFT_351015 [Lindgomyces ingoldianus]|uniref:Uncharacterized protein n=1 Tax=Lindgomyces ingoldianus TaxID=673940 RepID=A0ACB6R607_9PLEO|nr:uncharacterized protein BDR25DRAFT_351015 [Lindgomyces ingoldianus]KAF2474495.1 hypothetical protein BDR25DRAFT_351015 [Lindgomyces ingoldianus]